MSKYFPMLIAFLSLCALCSCVQISSMLGMDSREDTIAKAFPNDQEFIDFVKQPYSDKIVEISNASHNEHSGFTISNASSGGAYEYSAYVRSHLKTFSRNPTAVKKEYTSLEELQVKLMIDFFEARGMTVKKYKPELTASILKSKLPLGKLQSFSSPQTVMYNGTYIVFDGSKPHLSWMSVYLDTNVMGVNTTFYLNQIFINQQQTISILNSYKNSYIQEMEILY